jgi:hypothetical protein
MLAYRELGIPKEVVLEYARRKRIKYVLDHIEDAPDTGR